MKTKTFFATLVFAFVVLASGCATTGQTMAQTAQPELSGAVRLPVCVAIVNLENGAIAGEEGENYSGLTCLSRRYPHGVATVWRDADKEETRLAISTKEGLRRHERIIGDDWNQEELLAWLAGETDKMMYGG